MSQTQEFLNSEEWSNDEFVQKLNTNLQFIYDNAEDWINGDISVADFPENVHNIVIYHSLKFGRLLSKEQNNLFYCGPSNTVSLIESTENYQDSENIIELTGAEQKVDEFIDSVPDEYEAAKVLYMYFEMLRDDLEAEFMLLDSKHERVAKLTTIFAVLFELEYPTSYIHLTENRDVIDIYCTKEDAQNAASETDIIERIQINS